MADITKFIDKSGEESPIKDENAVHKSDIAQGLGDDANKVISQKAVTEALAGVGGKSAYEYAKEGGYTGTEEDFRQKLASEFAPARIGEVTLTAAGWVGAASPFSQIVEVEGVTENSQVDLTPSVAQLAIFYEKDLAFVTENEGGVVTVYAIGQKPENDYTMQVTITEVAV